MYYVKKSFEFAASHHLKLDYQSNCSRQHGHNYSVEVCCRGEELDSNGMLVDFKLIKERIVAVLDHKDLNSILPFNPTAENLARWICEQLPHCYRVSVKETSSNTAIYEK